ncbi:HlyD family secretion protein [Streptomyces sp. DSM 41987]|uniref:HlyD family secretion protein n=1 Tax=Streptomyces TaxID=1883 RepID=UPI001E3A0F57|nr:HlyD family secretion protein [Streptomyces fildesensis]
MTRSEAEPATGTEEDPTTIGASAPGSRRRRVRIVAAVLMTGLAGAGIAVGVPWGEGGNSTPSKADPSAGTVKVVRMDLSDSRSLDGTLGYGKPQTVKGAGGGIVTWLAPGGSTVTQGQVLYRVDDRAVPVFYGAVPLYRRLAGQNTVGRDVKVIAENLRALTYDIGVQPSPGQVVTVTAPADGTASAGGGPDAAPDGTASAKPSPAPGKGTPSGGSPAPRPSATGRGGATTGTGPTGSPGTVTQVRVKSGDGVLTRALVAAIKCWQTAQGVPSTGVIEPGDVAVLSGAVRVESAAAQVGDPVAAPLLKVTSTAKAVTVPVDASQAGSIKRADPVTVKLPDGTSTAGKVTDIGTDAEQSANGNGGPAKVTVTVSFTDPGKVKKLDSGPVQVEFVSETRPGVLAVPVAALLALREGGYGLRTADGRTVAVKTGLIAKGMAEISGDGIAEGTQVVTSS